MSRPSGMGPILHPSPQFAYPAVLDDRQMRNFNAHRVDAKMVGFLSNIFLPFCFHVYLTIHRNFVG